jgi:hypothetical protein
MKRKTSTLPTRVYKYALLPPTANAEIVERTFVEARIYYNKLVTIENRRRWRYRDARSRIFPELGGLEAEARALEEELKAARASVNSTKAISRTRKVNQGDKEKIDSIKKRLREVRSRISATTAGIKLAVLSEGIRRLEQRLVAKPTGKKRDALEKKLAKTRDKTRELASKATPASLDGARKLSDEAETADAEANASIKALRPTLNWGTYLLCEASAKQAASKTKGDLAYDETPPHLLRSRIGVEIMGGMGVADLQSDTQLQIGPMPAFRARRSDGKLRARFKAARTTLRFRVDSDERRRPIFAEFPMIMDRPLPADAKIKEAYVTRTPHSTRHPWQHHLCVVLESRELERALPGTRQAGRTTINLGWRLLEDGSLRVATVNNDARSPKFIELPARHVSGYRKCASLQSLLDEKFEAIKKQISTFIASHEADLPEPFLEAFENLPIWKSQHRLAELAHYWKDNRVTGDADLWPFVERWLERYHHLGDWLYFQRRRLQNYRKDFYERVSKDLALTSAEIVLDAFRIADVARWPAPEVEDEGGALARRNRVIAAPSELRLAIVRAAAKHHCPVVVAPAEDNTRRCNNCGTIQHVESLEHECSICPASWDQDVNNTDNLHDRAASGEVVPLVRPAEAGKDADFRSSETSSYGDARKLLAKSMKTK